MFVVHVYVGVGLVWVSLVPQGGTNIVRRCTQTNNADMTFREIVCGRVRVKTLLNTNTRLAIKATTTTS